MNYSYLTLLLKDIEMVQHEFELKRTNQEKFNIFSILHNIHDERRLHSRFISALLDRNSTHNKGTIFIKHLFSELDIFNDQNLEIVETYPNEINKSEFQDIDILVINRHEKFAVIIENKIYAGDSNSEESGQLERYFDYINISEKIPYQNIKVFYLTLDGHLPSDKSLGKYRWGNLMEWKCISYEKEITNWINRCSIETINQPFLRESLQQYLKIIAKMTNNETDISERIKLMNTIGQSDNTLSSTKYLMDNFKHVKWHAIHNLFLKLRSLLEMKNYEVPTEVEMDTKFIYYITHFETNRKEENGGLYFKSSNNIPLFIEHSPGGYALYWGFYKNGIQEEISIKLNQLVEKNLIEVNQYIWWNYAHFNTNERLNLKNFTSKMTFNLISDTYCKEVAENIVNNINEFMVINLGHQIK